MLTSPGTRIILLPQAGWHTLAQRNTSWEDAATRAVDTAAKSLRDLRVAEVTKMDLKVEHGKVVAFRTRLALSFKYEE
jgi:flavin-binding protein dodecin